MDQCRIPLQTNSLKSLDILDKSKLKDIANLPIDALQKSVCQCCLTTKNLKHIKIPYPYNGINEIYSDMLSLCFAELIFEDGHICIDCISRLRDVLNFKKIIQSTQNYLNSHQKNVKTEDCSTDDDNVSNNCLVDDNYLTESKRNESITSDCNNKLKTEDKSSDEDDYMDILYTSDERPKQIFTKEVFDIGEQKTLPYVLDNADRKCEICHKEFSFFGELSRHMPEHYPNHICDICGKICATRKSLKFHTKTHSDIRLNCKMCEKTFKNKSNLNAHVKVQHKGEKILFKCSQCGEVLNTYNSRIKHMAEKHGREDKSYKCTQCPCKYRLGSQLRAHVRRVHLQEKNHKCQVCSISFFTRKCLQNHIIIHSGERNFSCTVCQKSYSRKETLRQHMKSHEENYVLPNYG